MATNSSQSLLIGTTRTPVQGGTRHARRLRKVGKLLLFGGTAARGHGRCPSLNNGRPILEGSCTHFLLMAEKGIGLTCRGKFRLLYLFHISRHTPLYIIRCPIKHAIPHTVNTGESHKLIRNPLATSSRWKPSHLGITECLSPIERRQTLISQSLGREFGMDGLGKTSGFRYTRPPGFTPQQIGIRGIREATGNRLLDTGPGSVKTLYLYMPS